jgi:glycosyltransferase involved in cell wall biosynthesis
MPSGAKVSVVMATYNHAPFVAQAIESVLRQTYGDFEFLIADDGSSDSTSDVVSRFKDPRIEFVAHPVNRGACVVTNELIEKATGEYVAVMNSDDFWVLDKLAFQVDFMDRNREFGALFGRVLFVDRASARIPKSELPFGSVFDQENRSPGRWLRRFFDSGNCLCHPSVLIRRACYAELGLYDNRFRQLPDLDMWIRLAKRFTFFVADKDLISFRILPGENASSPAGRNLARTMNEYFLIGTGLFDGASKELLVEGFGDLLVFKNPPTEIHWDVEKALLYFTPVQWLGHAYKMVGLTRMFQLLGSRRHREVMQSDYRIDDLVFQRLSTEVEVFSGQMRIAILEGSKSWRLTAPLRAMRRRLRRGR